MIRAFLTAFDPLFTTRSGPGCAFQMRTRNRAVSKQPAREPAAWIFPSAATFGFAEATRQPVGWAWA
ncbi:hypothetical protein MPTA5024_32855 [Microbispora sp. ATCC PTA-5024]|nr:hypothetical protein MPTA5024_32855 [Microbispora sp. ATCC PTA-5024]